MPFHVALITYLCLVYWNVCIVVSDQQKVAPKAPLAGILCKFSLLLTVLLLGFCVLPHSAKLDAQASSFAL